MKMLLDECVPKRLKAKFGTIEVYTVLEWSQERQFDEVMCC
jgi:predicted nuclease of predicted toxin-antitoxin system